MWMIICILTSFTWFCTLLDIKTHSLVFRQVLSFALFFFQLEAVSVAWHCKPCLAGLGVQRSTYSCFIFHSSLRYSLSAWQWLDIAWHCLIKYLAWDLISQVQEPFSGLLLQAKISSVKCFQAIHEFSWCRGSGRVWTAGIREYILASTALQVEPVVSEPALIFRETVDTVQKDYCVM